MATAREESEWLVGLSDRHKQLFLATLGHELTIAARSTYQPQTEDLDHPRWMRRFNEVQHRVAACLYQRLLGRGNVEFLASIAEWVFEEGDDDVRQLLWFAWNEAKRRSCGET